MEDKLFCCKCHRRIWRWSDGMDQNDTYLEDKHMNCLRSLAWNNLLTNPETGTNPYEQYEPENQADVEVANVVKEGQ